MENLEELFQNMHSLAREERLDVIRNVERLRPEFARPFLPPWRWWRRCRVNVLIVTDGGLNFGIGGVGLSEFLTTFIELEATTSVDYRLTLGHRTNSVSSSNPTVVNQIQNFKFDSSVNLEDFDQLWMFGISPFGSISPSEVSAIEDFMDNGGGVFATGDHGSLGRAMCGDIKRIKDMRFWNDTDSDNDLNEVSMTGERRNDTNQPQPGNTFSNNLSDQSDNIPQTIAVRTFQKGNPHPLLSIPTSKRPSGIVDIMPDHPHEGQCKQEKEFTENGISVRSQIIATSFVPEGNAGGKDPAIAHCFPSIAVWDGWKANAGRIVVDSTWHHFVDLNVMGLTTNDFEVIRHYYMNIARWMSRKKYMLCIRRFAYIELLRHSQLIETVLNNPAQSIEEVSVKDMESMGTIAHELLGELHTPSFAKELFSGLVREYNPSIANELDPWTSRATKKVETDITGGWLNTFAIENILIGAGFLSLRDDKSIGSNDFNEKDLDRMDEVFLKGMQFGQKIAVQSLMNSVERFQSILNDESGNASMK